MISEIFQDPEFGAKVEASLWMFLQLFFELAILFLLISFVVGLINQKLPPEKVQQVLGAKNGRGYFTAAAIGALTPFCSCSSIPLLIGLLRAKAGFGPVMTFLFTSPLLNPIIVMLFFAVLGWQITLAYAVLALSFALFSGWLLNRLGFEKYIKSNLLTPATESCCDTDNTTKTSNSCCTESTPKAVALKPWQIAWNESVDLFKSMMPYMVIAMAIGAIVHGFVPEDFFAEMANADNAAAVPVAATIGIPLYVRVSTLLPLIGSFIAKGVSIGAVIAFVIGSGGASIPEFILLKRLFHWPLLLAFLTVIFTMAILGGYTMNAIFT
ncbi:MAG: permease [Aquificaceae bacterium]|nr:MAG: permease [Aquificaceae bacterium]